MRKITFTIFLLLISLTVHSKELIGEPKQEAFAYPNLYYTNNGPALEESDFAKLRMPDSGRAVGANYRVGFLNFEIYTSFLVELITFGEEGSGLKIRKTYFLRGFDVANIMGEGNITGATFLNWADPKTFRINIGTKDKPFIIRIVIGQDGKFQLTQDKQ